MVPKTCYNSGCCKPLKCQGKLQQMTDMKYALEKKNQIVVRCSFDWHFKGINKIHGALVVKITNWAQLFKTNDVFSQCIVKTLIIKYGKYANISAEKM